MVKKKGSQRDQDRGGARREHDVPACSLFNVPLRQMALCTHINSRLFICITVQRSRFLILLPSFHCSPDTHSFNLNSVDIFLQWAIFLVKAIAEQQVLHSFKGNISQDGYFRRTPTQIGTVRWWFSKRLLAFFKDSNTTFNLASSWITC